MIERYSLPRMAGIWKDEFKFATMLEIELLALEAFARAGKIPRAVPGRCRKKARFSISRIRRIEEKTQHDIVAFVTDVASSIGSDAQYLHAGLTSSDVLDTTLGVQLSAASKILLEGLRKARAAVGAKARKYKMTGTIGRTHGIHAEPTTFGLKLALWYDELGRSITLLQQAHKAVAVGKISGAVGTFSNVDPRVEAYICRKLGIAAAPISTQVVQRDVYAQFVSALAVIGASLEKFALEIRHLQRTEVHEAEEPFGKGQKGSSAMPHKRNPVICERICGLARILRGNALVALENVALWHERDISHSSAERVILPDSTLCLDYMLHKFIQVVEGMTVFPREMRENMDRSYGLFYSQRVLLALMEKGLPRPKAYDLVQRCAMRSWQEKKLFKTMLLEDRDVPQYLSAKDLESLFDARYFLRNVNRIFTRVGL
jgi:adenylosuccinate lyase